MSIWRPDRSLQSRLHGFALPIGPTIIGIFLALASNYLYGAFTATPTNYTYLLVGGLLLSGAVTFYLLHAVFVGEKDVQRSDFARSQIRHALMSILVNADACLEGKLGQKSIYDIISIR
jgi:hypothetical protein